MFWCRRHNTVSKDEVYMITPVSPTFLKQEAKKLKKTQNLSMSEALDETSKKFGFSNYRHYLNCSEANLKQPKPAIEEILKSISSEQDIFKKLDIAISSIIKFKIPFHEQLDILKLFSRSNDADDSYDSDEKTICEKLKLAEDLRHKDYGVEPYLQFMCEKLSLMKDEIQTFLLNEFLTENDEDKIYDDIDPDHFITKKFSIRNTHTSMIAKSMVLSEQKSIEIKTLH